MPSTKLFAIVAGAGPGTGKATALRFAKAYPVVLLARRPESYAEAVAAIEAAGGTAVGISADATDPASLDAAFERIARDLFPGHRLAAAVFNAAGGFARKPFLEQTGAELAGALDGSVKGLWNFAQKTIPLLLETVSAEDKPSHPPSLLVTGATASVRGSAQFGPFAAGMFARRALAQSLAREFGPRGVHVAHAVIDGVIDIPRTKAYAVNGGVEDGKISADAIAESYWHLHTQPRSAFTQEIDLRPFVEKF
ncbi:hypothetical protein SLS62_007010 [Diatrype stigma]|uniref:Short chain dehydrogenase n=1 Tax=Diatrype stigma TaxID=117547 RepID=A0AAN9YR48_9PEZI